MIIGVLGLQGDIEEHISHLKKCSVKYLRITHPTQIKEINGLIIPGGESTTIGKLAKIYDIDNEIIIAAQNNLPIWGTCAGMIFLSKTILNNDKKQNILKLLDVSIVRNASGRQFDSFEQKLDFPKIKIEKFISIFIRAPFVKEKNIIATSFHPELTDDTRFHQYFINLVKQNN